MVQIRRKRLSSGGGDRCATLLCGVRPIGAIAVSVALGVVALTSLEPPLITNWRGAGFDAGLAAAGTDGAGPDAAVVLRELQPPKRASWVPTRPVRSRTATDEAAADADAEQKTKTASVSVTDGHESMAPPLPHVAWLLTFPNAGSTLALGLVSKVTNTTTGTNRKSRGLSLLHSEYSKEGPMADRGKNSLRLPEKYILTKTHCAYTNKKGSAWFLNASLEGFQRGCLTDIYHETDDPWKKRPYNLDMVKKAVHIIRNPFDNVLSRSRAQSKPYRRETNRDSGKEWFVETKPKSEAGFRSYCKGQRSLVPTKAKLRVDESEEMSRLHEELPCADDFYRYIQWHNFAFQVTEQLGLSTVRIHYEDFGDHFRKTVDKLLTFLELPWVADPLDVSLWQDHDSYFSKEEKDAAWFWMKKWARNDTWDSIRRYR